jgi:hypothetical protein
MAGQPRVELLWWRGCPSWERCLVELRQGMAEIGLDPESVEVREIRTEADAAREGFPGSPTIRVDGRDVQDPGDQPVGLSCRIYRLDDGRVSPLPDPAGLRRVLIEAARVED